MKDSTKQERQDRRQELVTLIEVFALSGSMHVVERLKRELKQLDAVTEDEQRKDKE